mmetsp:Transcript_43291/g.139111  ORF Transcript_43291/g.139111 Transcript_43291/m.139111 type:complete len:156 (+) Transcript_43291:45-512(+)
MGPMLGVHARGLEPAKTMPARTFVWSYPVDGWDALVCGHSAPSGFFGGNSRGSEGERSSAAASSFLRVGGFVYIDKEYNILQCNTLMAASYVSSDRGLYFSTPRSWRPEWTAALRQQNRFQEVTIQALIDVGARYFCWLRPDEFFSRFTCPAECA